MTKRATKSRKPKRQSTKVSSKEPKRFGRPSIYDPAFCESIVKHMQDGGTMESFASSLGIHKDTLSEWAQKYPEFSVARKLAKQEAEVFMIKLGQLHMVGKPVGVDHTLELVRGKKTTVKHVRFLSPSMWQFFMKCRFGWREDAQPTDQDENELEFAFEDNG